MKNLIIVFICCFGYQSQAQTFKEFFRQKETQKEYLMKQIIALKFYGDFLKEGYGIVDSGLNTIKNFNKTEFSLHSGYFNSLKGINPVVANSPMIGEITNWKNRTINLLGNLKTQSQTGTPEAEYIEKVKSKVISECQKEFSILKLVLTPGKLELTDEERLNQIEKLHKSMQNKYEFAESFVHSVKLLENQKRNEQLQLKASKEMFNLK